MSVAIHPSAAEGANGNSAPIQSPPNAIGIGIDISAQSGTTPTIDFEVEWSPDGVNFGSAETPDTFTQIGAATPTVAKRFTVKAPWYRLVWTLGGTTPNYTFAAYATHG